MNTAKLTLTALVAATLGLAATAAISTGPGTGWRAADCPRAQLRDLRPAMVGDCYHVGHYLGRQGGHHGGHRVGHHTGLRMGDFGHHRGGPGWGEPAQVNPDAVKAGLGITADQEAAWDAYVDALEHRSETVTRHREAMHALTPAERAQARDNFRAGRGDRHTQLMEARDRLLETLDPEQRAKAQGLPGLGCAPRPVEQQS
jgi:hypothetical protein